MNTYKRTGIILLASASFALAEGKVDSSAKTTTTTESKTSAPTAKIDPYAVKIMQRAGSFLAEAKHFSVSAEVWQELEDENGNLLQFSKNVDLKVNRPNKLRVDVSRNEPTRSFYYDGKSLTMQDHQTGFFGQVKAPDTIDAMVEKVDSDLAVSLPLEDFVLSQPFGGAAKKATAAQYLGKENVLGTSCHHVAFQSNAIQWQAWVDDGVLPVMRKVVIIFKEEVGEPRFTVLLSDWDVSTPLGDHLFEFAPAPGVIEIDVIGIKAEAKDIKKSEPKK